MVNHNTALTCITELRVKLIFCFVLCLFVCLSLIYLLGYLRRFRSTVLCVVCILYVCSVLPDNSNSPETSWNILINYQCCSLFRAPAQLNFIFRRCIVFTIKTHVLCIPVICACIVPVWLLFIWRSRNDQIQPQGVSWVIVTTRQATWHSSQLVCLLKNPC